MELPAGVSCLFRDHVWLGSDISAATSHLPLCRMSEDRYSYLAEGKHHTLKVK